MTTLPRLFKTDKGEVINLLTLIHMYKNYDGEYVVKMEGNNQTTVSTEDFEQIYEFFKVKLI